jgi:NADH dehydrogenase FAD-containing subunit
MRRLSENLEIQVTRIDQRTYHVLYTECYEIISGNTSFKGLLFSLPALCANYVNVTFKNRMLSSLVFKQKVILLTEGRSVRVTYHFSYPLS